MNSHCELSALGSRATDRAVCLFTREAAVPTCLWSPMSYKSRKELSCNGRKAESSWVDTDCLKGFCFFLLTQTGRQHIQGCSIIHALGSSLSPISSHPTRLTRPSQYYQEDVCLHGSDSEQQNSSLGSDDCHRFWRARFANTQQRAFMHMFWWTALRHGRRNKCNTQQSQKQALLSVSVTHRTVHNTKEDFHSSLSPFSEMHTATHSLSHTHTTHT